MQTNIFQHIDFLKVNTKQAFIFQDFFTSACSIWAKGGILQLPHFMAFISLIYVCLVACSSPHRWLTQPSAKLQVIAYVAIRSNF